jgi:hypothetical protein
MSATGETISDIGNGFGKFCNGSDENILFPHALLELEPYKFNAMLERDGKLNEDYFRTGETENEYRYWVVGNSVYRHDPSPILLRGARRYAVDYYGVLLQSGLSRLYKPAVNPRRINVTASYAPGDRAHRKALKASIPQTATITTFTKRDQEITHRFEIDTITLIEEGKGALFDYLLTPNGKEFTVRQGEEMERMLVFDFGHKTLEMLGFEELQPVYSEYKSIPMGIGDIRRQLKERLQDAFAVSLNGHELTEKDITIALNENRLRLYGKSTNVSSHVDEVVNGFMAQFLRVYNEDYRGGRDYHTIILAGGGAEMIHNNKRYLKHANITLACKEIKDTIFCNVNGGNKYRRFIRDAA